MLGITSYMKGVRTMSEHNDKQKTVRQDKNHTQKSKRNKLNITVTSNTPSPEAIENFNRELNRIAQELYYR